MRLNLGSKNITKFDSCSCQGVLSNSNRESIVLFIFDIGFKVNSPLHYRKKSIFNHLNI